MGHLNTRLPAWAEDGARSRKWLRTVLLLRPGELISKSCSTLSHLGEEPLGWCIIRVPAKAGKAEASERFILQKQTGVGMQRGLCSPQKAGYTNLDAEGTIKLHQRVEPSQLKGQKPFLLPFPWLASVLVYSLLGHLSGPSSPDPTFMYLG